MKYISSFLVVLSFSIFFVIPQYVNAQFPNTYKTCLKSESCRDVDCPGSSGKPGVWPGHTAKLSESQDPQDKKPLPNKDTYIVVCISNPESPHENERFLCTTGSKVFDRELYGTVTRGGQSLDILDIMGSDPNVGIKYEFIALYTSAGQTSPSKVMSRGDGGIGPLEWSDRNPPPGRQRQWFAIQHYNPDEATDADGAGHKEATFEWEAAQKDCASIGWDPYGRLFDAETLEPIGGLELVGGQQLGRSLVELYFDSNRTFLTPTPIAPPFFRLINIGDTQGSPLINPQTIDEDGQFSFVVPDNDYILKLKPGFEIEASRSAIHSNWSKVYSDLYTPDEVIQQRGRLIHRDIPVKSLKRPYGNVKVYDLVIDRVGNKMVLSGRVSHPFAKINIETSKIYASASATPGIGRVLDGGRADKFGKYRVEIDQALLEVTATYREVPTGANFVATDLRSLALDSHKSIFDRLMITLRKFLLPRTVEAMTLSLPIDPMPSNLEGYARDSKGTIIPNAKVGLYLKFAGKPDYETIADANGYFKISSRYIPTSPYEIRYVSPSNVITAVSTTEFITQNQQSPSGVKTDPFTVRDENDKVVPSPKSNNNSPVTNLNNGVRQTGNTVSQQSMQTNKMNPAVAQTMVVLILIILLLGGVGVGVFLYIKNKTPQQGTW